MPKDKEKPKTQHASGLPNFPELETSVLKRWQEKKIFEATLEQTKNGPRFVFFEGPPTANGRPGIHHVLARAFKDVLPRYKTMRGFFVERKAGWDTQGLPVELEVEKQIGVSGKKDIEKYGIEKFNEECRKSVWKYKEEWEKLTERIGFWLDLEHPYITYEKPYIETLWWIFKHIWEKQLLIKDYKVVPHCPRCETALSSHEVAQGYKKVKEKSVYLKFELEDEPGTFVLAWTTTPWTLPGNVALAVGEDVQYAKVRFVNNKINTTQKLILAIDRIESIFEEYFLITRDRLVEGAQFATGKNDYADYTLELEKIYSGSELLGKKYKPLFDIPAFRENSKAYQIYAADFVSTEDGTGVVHTAVMYGVEDYELGQQVGLPKIHTVNQDGTFNHLVPQWEGWHVKHKDKAIEAKTTKAIVEDLRLRGLLYKEEEYEHDYPFCWRCDTPLLYYAKDSWFITMSKLRDEMQQRNATINWVPEYIKEGRFGEWLRDAKDWAISRERYWGTPLPIWECGTCHKHECVGSYDELAKKGYPANNYFLIRHGEAETQTLSLNGSWPETQPFHLTDKGRGQVKEAAKDLKHKHIDFILASDLTRTKETAEILAAELNVTIEYDARLREIDTGAANGRSYNEYHELFSSDLDRFDQKKGDAEILRDVRRRMVACVKELQSKYRGKTILIVSHGDPLWMLETGFRGFSDQESVETKYFNVAEVRRIDIPRLPYDDEGHVDPHKPFVDAVVLPCACGGEMRRVSEVADTWFDSGSMPFAQWHYPFENKERIDASKAYPADFISEAIDQTRGWFYTLLALATVLEKEAPYKNVICLGHILDAKGQKMSKHVGNVVDPWEVINEFGADPLRFLLYTMNQPGEYKLFDPKQVGEVVRKTFFILWNVLSFRDLFASDSTTALPAAPINLLDRWLLTRTEDVRRKVTEALDRYAVTDAGRILTEFVTELSTWYIRRSRSRFKAEGVEKQEAVATLTFTLQTVAKLFAPFTPFFAELVYERSGGKRDSVHLEPWPEEIPGCDEALLRSMELTRQIVEAGHALREEASMKVRQPLGQLVLTGAKLPHEALAILRDELNIHDVVCATELPTGVDWKTKTTGALQVALDTTLTDELLAEGWYREVLRTVMDLRKTAGLQFNDIVKIIYSTESEKAQKFFAHYSEKLLKETRGESLGVSEMTAKDSKTVQLGAETVQIGIERTERSA